MSDFRRRLMMDSEENPDYIQDGLVFNLDGTDKCATSQYAWVDKIGGIGFTKQSAVTEIENGFTFLNAYYSLMIGSRALTTRSDIYNYTMEVVIKPTATSAWASICTFGGWNYSTLSMGVKYCVDNNTSNISWSSKYPYSGAAHSVYLIPFNQISTNSVLYDKCYTNKSLDSISTTTPAFSNPNDTLVIGCRTGNTNGHFVGDIYAIRVYSRKLTQEEILYNQLIDIDKYNIVIN